MRVPRGRRVPGLIKYPKNQKADRSVTLEAALRRILILGSRAQNLTIAAAPHPKREEVVRNFLQWKSQIRPRPSSLFVIPIRTDEERAEDVEGTPPPIIEVRVGEIENNFQTIDQREEGREVDIISEEEGFGDTSSMPQANQEVMESQNSIIWNNKSAEQMDSSLSLVVNPPSLLSQQDDSASDDSQLTRSSQLNLDDERRWLRYRVETLTRDECIIFCVLGQMILSGDEMTGIRDGIPTDEEARQSLLSLSYGGYWELNNLRSVLDLAEFLPAALRRLGGFGVRGRGEASRKTLEGRLETCLDLGRRLDRPVAS